MVSENRKNNLTNKDNKKELYLSPHIEFIEVKVEKGFAASRTNDAGSSAPGWNSGGAW